MNRQTALYDAPGPRAKRMTYIGSLVAVVLIAAAAYYLVFRPLDAHGEFTMAKWGALIDPGNENFTALWKRIWDGFQATLIAAALAVVASALLGTVLAVVRLQLKAMSGWRYSTTPRPVAVLFRTFTIALDWLSRILVEVFRGLPVVITIIFVWFGLPSLGIEFDHLLWYLVVGLVLYNTVVIAEILRSGMEGLPVGQREAAQAIGLSTAQTTRLILLPQAYRIMLPALISQFVVILKDTSLGFIIGYEEILRVTTQIVQFLNNQIQMYVVVGTIYILINYGLSKLAVYLERMVAKGRKTPATTPGAPAPSVAAEIAPAP